MTLVFTITGCRAAASPSASGVESLAAAPSRTATPTLSATASPSTTPNPQDGDSFAILPAARPDLDIAIDIVCTGNIGANDPVAIVQLVAAEPFTGDIVMRDYADPANPRTACTSKAQPAIYQVIDARHVVVQALTNGGNPWTFAVVDLPEVRFHWFALPQSQRGFPQFIAVSPGLDQIAWMTTDLDVANADTIHITTATGDHVVATFPDDNDGRCGTVDDSRLGAYTQSGDHLFVLDQPFPMQASLGVFEGETPVLTIEAPIGFWPDGGQPAMALWSPTSATLFYRQAGDIWKWTPGSDPVRFLAGVSWYYPTISPDGAHLAYQLNDAGGPHVYLVDLAHGGSPKLIGSGGRKLPVFVNSSQLWFRSIGNDHGCAGAEEERPLIYSLVDGSEAPSVIEGVLNVWPATSSNF